ncbi:ABC transporter permease subunit [Aerococcus sp. UMB1112A]|uniref:ABC transporter permease n=1 Tax=Aerococcus sp. UMB1112A TaxID=3050609 RepID=UPI00254C8AEB|nr:ABC transporter permease subunit [Aerococcus sp. UMB1112A]MDK8502356.1 ABC transporter permease subunit [Aerococcus sp. UMB1112A]
MKQGLGVFKAFITVFFLLILAVLVYPVITMILASFQDAASGAFTLNNYKEIFTTNIYTEAFRNSILISLYSSLVGLFVTSLATYAIVSYLPKMREAFLVLANLTNNYVGVPLAFGFIILLGNSGVLVMLDQVLGWNILSDFNIYSLTGLLIVFIYFQLPMGITLLIPIFDGLDKRWSEAAELLGANSFQYWTKIGLPILAPSLIGTFCIMFANAMGAYDSAIALTGSSINLLSVRIGNTVSGDLFAKPEIGSSLAVVLAMILAINMVFGHYVSNRLRRDLR